MTSGFFSCARAAGTREKFSDCALAPDCGAGLSAYPAMKPIAAAASAVNATVFFMMRSSKKWIRSWRLGNKHASSSKLRTIRVSTLLLVGRPFRIEANLLQHFRLAVHFLLVGRKFFSDLHEYEKVAVRFSLVGVRPP